MEHNGKISWTEHYKLNSAGNDWRRKSPDTVMHTPRKRQRIWNEERDKGNGTDMDYYLRLLDKIRCQTAPGCMNKV